MTFLNNFTEAANFYRSLNKEEKNQLVLNLSDDLENISNQSIQLRIICYLYRSDKDFGTRMAHQLGFSQQDVVSLLN